MNLGHIMVFLMAVTTMACSKNNDKQQGSELTTTASNGGFVWSENPKLDSIPDGPITGDANGHPFEAKAIYFEPRMGQWHLIISEGALKSPTSLAHRGQSVVISLPEEPSRGKVYQKGLEYGGGYFQIQSPQNPAMTTSWNAPNSMTLEITLWDVSPYDPKGGQFQSVGIASGRVAVCYKGIGGGLNDSWVAGSFKDAVVRYMGKPQDR